MLFKMIIKTQYLATH